MANNEEEKFSLISFEESLKELEDDIEFQNLKEKMRTRTIDEWFKRVEKEEEENLENPDPKLKEEPHTFEIPHLEILTGIKPDDEYIEKGIIFHAFDESTVSAAGDYARIIAYKFAEAIIDPNKGGLRCETVHNEPMLVYLEDTLQKVHIYYKVIKNFVEKISEKFEKTPLKKEILDVKDWFNKVFEPVIVDAITRKNQQYVGMKYVQDRIRTADELLRSILTIHNHKDDPELQLFLGDGIAAFRPHIFPPPSITNFVKKLLHHYGLKYYTFSKTCQLRDRNGTLILPQIRANKPKGVIAVKIPQKRSKSITYICRLTKEGELLRYDVPDFMTETQALKELTKIIPYSPLCYPECLKHAHEASQLLIQEKTNLHNEFTKIELEPKKKHLVIQTRKALLG